MVETLRFLYDKRLTLFNTRRDHEWKIFFGGMTLLAGADAALLSRRLVLVCWERYMWVAWCSVVLIVVVGYERALQVRNHADRLAMSAIYNQLCDLARIADTRIRERVKGAEPVPHGFWTRYGRAFPWQMILFLAAVVASAYLGFR